MALSTYPNNLAALRHDEGAGEMKKGDVVVGVLVPAHQDVPETVQPTVPLRSTNQRLALKPVRSTTQRLFETSLLV